MWKLIPLRAYLFAGLAAALVLYHYVDRARAVDDALSEERKKMAVSILKTQIEYRDRWIDTDGMLSYLASIQRTETFRIQQSIRNRALQDKKEYRDALSTLPPSGCVIDADRLRLFNEIISRPREGKTP